MKAETTYLWLTVCIQNRNKTESIYLKQDLLAQTYMLQMYAVFLENMFTTSRKKNHHPQENTVISNILSCHNFSIKMYVEFYHL